jgi:hypothetical protein
MQFTKLPVVVRWSGSVNQAPQPGYPVSGYGRKLPACTDCLPATRPSPPHTTHHSPVRRGLCLTPPQKGVGVPQFSATYYWYPQPYPTTSLLLRNYRLPSCHICIPNCYILLAPQPYPTTSLLPGSYRLPPCYTGIAKRARPGSWTTSLLLNYIRFPKAVKIWRHRISWQGIALSFNLWTVDANLPEIKSCYFQKTFSVWKPTQGRVTFVKMSCMWKPIIAILIGYVGWRTEETRSCEKRSEMAVDGRLKLVLVWAVCGSLFNYSPRKTTQKQYFLVRILNVRIVFVLRVKKICPTFDPK